MDKEIEELADVLGRAVTTGSADLCELLTDAANRSIAAPQLVPRLQRVFSRYRGNPVAGPLASQDLLEVLRVARRRDTTLYEELRTIAEAFAEDEQARTAPAPRRAPEATANSNAVSGGTFNEAVVQAGSITGGLHTYYGQPPHSGLAPVADWPQLDRADPIALGVHRTRRIADEPLLPRYVARDCDPELDAQVRSAARDGGLVLVTGDPLSGKTRTLWAALFTNLSGTTRVLAPLPGTDLRAVPTVLRGRGDAECVLWLDDLDRHLGEHGLTAALLAELARLRVPVLATMSDEAYDAHRFGSPDHARLLSGVEPVELGTDWSPAETERLAAAAPGDLRLAGAYAHRARHSTTAYLTVGPELFGEWRRARRANAHPLGHRIVLAAVDLARCGVEEAQADVLRRACELYGDTAPVSPEEFDEAREWASRIRHGTTGMLVPGTEAGSWRAYGSLVEDVKDGLPGFGPVPLELWLFAVDTVGRVNDVLVRARAVLGPEADTNPEALLTLGRIEEEYGDEEAAEVLLRRAADAGSTEAAGRLGGLLFDRQDNAAAIPYLEKGAESGDTEAQCRLGIALMQRSEHWLRTAAESGDGLAALWLGDLLCGNGAMEDALRWYLKAAGAGMRADVATRIGEVLFGFEEYEEAEEWFRTAVEEGDSDGLNGLGRTYEARGALQEAARFYERSAASGDPTGAYNFAIILEDQGKPNEARKWFVRAHERGDCDGAFSLGLSLMRGKKFEEAEVWLRKAQEVGHHRAERALADLKAARTADGPGSPAPGAPDNVTA
ncbi:TPR repeat [Streptomyces sp. Termitarium-T10T-6]|nr:tetratricopeptide repeat protein [Streptomyces sp. Termitarium-T10T-6]SCD88352.1 TPR repeat [Streptomyces sp. Termitarium-T10T-6]